VIAAVAVVVAVAALVVPRLSGGDEGDRAPMARATATTTKEIDPRYGDLGALERRTPNDPLAKGDKDAPVVMIVYADFQCPYCGKYARTTERQLVEKYVDTGVLRIEWRDFPYLGKESVAAAHAARAAAQQHKFWSYHDALYAHQYPTNSGKLSKAHLVDVARRIGLDVDRFTRDMDSALVAKLVQHDYDEGLSVGLNATPSFLVNGTPIVGAMPLSDFEKTIERARRKAEADG
jgi:protein-disulfide isomerase